MTYHNVQEKDLHGTRKIGDEHVASNKAVRSSMLQRRIKPEELPPGEDVKKVERRLKAEGDQLKKSAKKLGKKNSAHPAKEAVTSISPVTASCIATRHSGWRTRDLVASLHLLWKE